VKKLTVATTNPGKIHEVRLALQEFPGWTIDPLPDGIPDVDESGTTFIENATLKAMHYSRLVDGLVLADDSGLCVKSLGDRPGVWTARYGTTAEAQNRRVLNELGETPNRDAAFHCAFVVARSGLVVWTTEATLAGQITDEPVGDSGFGFDPIFFVPELGKTLAQVTAEEKNHLSARGKALNELKRFLSIS